MSRLRVLKDHSRCIDPAKSERVEMKNVPINFHVEGNDFFRQFKDLQA